MTGLGSHCVVLQYVIQYFNFKLTFRKKYYESIHLLLRKLENPVDTMLSLSFSLTSTSCGLEGPKPIAGTHLSTSSLGPKDPRGFAHREPCCPEIGKQMACGLFLWTLSGCFHVWDGGQIKMPSASVLGRVNCYFQLVDFITRYLSVSISNQPGGHWVARQPLSTVLACNKSRVSCQQALAEESPRI